MAGFRRLDADASLMFDADACLEMRPAASPCGHCRSACPVSAFDWSDRGVLVTERCLGCGQCASACPAGALSVRGFAINLTALNTSADAIRVECARVPERLRGDAVRVPCLGGVSKDEWVKLCAAGEGRPVHAIDRGWCGACVAGGAGFGGTQAVEEAGAVLAAIGCAESLGPQVVRCPAPWSNALPLRSERDAEALGRRAFFGAWVKRVAAAAQPVPSGGVAASRAARCVSPTIRSLRRSYADAIARLSHPAARRAPAALFPQLLVAAGCDNQGLCAAVCPSGALRPYHDDEGTTGLQFEAELCIACGLCVERCPTRAIALRPAGAIDAEWPAAAARLTRFSEQGCSRCGANFVGKPGASVCAPCRAERRLVASLFPAFSREPKRAAEKDFH